MRFTECLKHLTVSDIKVMYGLAGGGDYEEIAHKQGVSYFTVKKSAPKIYRLLGARSRVEASRIIRAMTRFG